MSSKPAIVLFRNDLRVQDNEALARAIKNHKQIIPVFVFDDRLMRGSFMGIPRMGKYRLQFLGESVRNLQNQLEAKGGKLLVRQGRTEDVIRQIAEKYGADCVYLQKEVTAYETRVEESLSSFIPLQFTWGSTLYHLQDLPVPPNQIPDIFTAFRKSVEKKSRVRELISAPERIHTPLDQSEVDEPAFRSTDLDHRVYNQFKGGAEAARQRLNHYFWESRSLSNYKWTRNGLLGEDYSSKFSPWLANGCISPRQIYHEVKRYEKEIKKNVSTYWLVFELIWRDFFRFIALKYGNRIFQYNGLKTRGPVSVEDSEAFKKWAHGETREPFVNANMKELNLSGFMSNRGRQNVASYLVHDLELDWRLGAAWFEHLLIDYDPCSNYGNWQYVAGVGTDPRPNRYFNIQSQQKKYDPKGEYVQHWLSPTLFSD